jgi:hypothetical protein
MWPHFRPFTEAGDTTMIKKSLIVTTLAAAGIGLAALPAEARRNDDRAAGAIIGGTIGALIGSSVHGGDGALVGGLLGAAVGAGSVGSYGYYGGGYYEPRYYGGARYAPRYGYGNGYYRAGGRRDADRDGVPNRYDRAPHNPRWR